MRIALTSLALASLCACNPSSPPATVTQVRESRITLDASALDATSLRDAASERGAALDGAADASEASVDLANADPAPIALARGLDNDCPPEPGRAAIPPLAMPVAPPEIAGEVRRLRPFVARSMRCFETSFRFAHVRAPDCAPALDELSRGGLAGVYAIGQFGVDERAQRISASERALMRSQIRNLTTREVEMGSASILIFGDSIGAVLARSQRTEAAASILAILDRFMRCESSADVFMLDRIRPWLVQLVALVGFDVAPQAPWTVFIESVANELGEGDSDRSAERRAEQEALNYRAYRLWALWYAAHRTESYAQWRAIALAHNRRALASRAVAERVSAIEQLSAATASREDRDAAMISLQDLLANGRLSSAARRYLRGQFGAQLADASIAGDASQDGAVDAR